jgi:hypothetical protein
MKCPHCLENFHEQQSAWSVGIGSDVEGEWIVTRATCPACNKFVLFLLQSPSFAQNRQGVVGAQALIQVGRTMVRPRGISRTAVPPEVPKEIAENYKEACLVLADSPKASAALSRRCLQLLLRSAAGVTHGDLSTEIQQVLDSRTLTTSVAENVDAIRNIGNFAAHPNKSTSTGEVLPVEPEEAEWTLDVLELLFDFYYVQPARAKAKRDALNKKLEDAKKPPMKR